MAKLRYKHLEEIDKAVTEVLKKNIDGFESDNVSITILMRNKDVKESMKSIALDQGIYLGDSTFDSIGGCEFTINNVRFKLDSK